MKTALIRQPAGLGDILFTYKIAKKLITTGKVDIVYWPVNQQYICLRDYIKDSKIVFVKENDEFPYKEIYNQDPYKILDTPELLYIPLQRADNIISYKEITGNHPMYCKYELVNLSFFDWNEFINIERNVERELVLEKYLNITGKQFNLVNKTFGTPPGTAIARSVPFISDSVEITNLSFDNPFDWCSLFLKASEIHTVDTSFCYILAALKIKNVTVYSRNTVTDFRYINRILPSDWKYISL